MATNTTTIAEAIFFCFIFLISTLLVKFFFKTSKGITGKQPPSPPALPIVGHLHLLSFRIHRSFQTLASRYGPLMLIRVGSTTSYVVSDANTAKHIFRNHDLSFASKPSFGAKEYDIYDNASFFISEYGAYWRFLKKLCMTELLSPARIRQFSMIRAEERTKLLESLFNSSRKGESCDLGEELTAMSNNIICRMVMSTRCSGNRNASEKIRELAERITQIAGMLAFGEVLGPFKKLLLLWCGRKLVATMTEFDELLEGMLKEHEEKSGATRREGKDMMDTILEILKDETADFKLTRTHVKAFLHDIFFGGTDTTSALMQWTLGELIRHPNVVMKIREEIERVVGCKRLVEESDVVNLPYLQAVIKESLRLYPSIPMVVRKCREDCTIDGYSIPENSRVLVNVFAIMRDQNVWENPNEFEPERFLKDNESCSIKGSDFTYCPFGGGRRACPGADLAGAVMHATIGMLVQCFDWEIKGKVDMEEGSAFVLSMRRPIVCFPIALVNPLELNSPQEVN